ncbi:MAG: hypothetical protein BWY45_03343 [Euryarchaeota archaeon ADurb.Bin294]|nr:MAG: hypothetical protein BWY45_03343 [Euryarchaeota archaeon ADurb.Bin294]
MDVCQCSGQLTVHFFRIRCEFVPRTQTRLNMADTDTIIIRRKCCCKRCCCITLYNDHVDILMLQYSIKPGEDACGDMVERLIFLHEIQIVVGFYREDIQYLIEHLPVLCCHTSDHMK